MNSGLFGLLDLLLVFAVVLGFGAWQLWSWLRWRKAQRGVEKQGNLPEK